MRDPALYAEAVRLHTGSERLGYKKIAERIGRSSQTVGNWLREWKRDQAKEVPSEPEEKLEATFRGKPLTEAKLEAFWEVYNHGHPTQGDQWDELMPALGRHVATSLSWLNAHPTKSREQFKRHLLKEIERLHL